MMNQYVGQLNLGKRNRKLTKDRYVNQVTTTNVTKTKFGHLYDIRKVHYV